MTDDDYDALSQKQLASIKRAMRISLNDAAVRATHKVVTELIEEEVKAERASMTKDEVLKLALEALKASPWKKWSTNKAIDSIQQALAQPVQPADLHNRLADLHLYEEIAEHYAKCAISPEALRDWVAERVNIPPLPVQPQRQWVGLTDGVMCDIAIEHGLMSIDWIDFARAIEAKLKEKNT